MSQRVGHTWAAKNSSSTDSVLKSKDITANKGLCRESYGFSSSHVWMWELDHKKDWVLKNWCFLTVMLKTFESSLDHKEIKPVNPNGNQSWIFFGRTYAEAEASILWPLDEERTHWKRPWFWERLKAEGKGGDRGWGGWMASSTQWTWVWVNSGSCWWAGRPGVLPSIGSQRVWHDWATELDWSV